MHDIKAVYEQVVAVREDVAYIKGTLESVNDHEQRIRWLEKWKWGLPATLLTSVLAAGTIILSQVGS